MTSEPEKIELNGRLYTMEELARLEEWCHRIQYNTLESILEERGLTSLERLERFEEKEDLGDHIRLVTSKAQRICSYLFGLEISWLAVENGITKGLLREKMDALGNRIWEAVGKKKPDDDPS
jgi:hypothetical protein